LPRSTSAGDNFNEGNNGRKTPSIRNKDTVLRTTGADAIYGTKPTEALL